MRTLTALFLASCVLAAAGQQPGQPAALQRQEVALPPFVEVDLCAPISVLILPNTTGDGYSLVMEAEQAVLAALSYTVQNNALLLATSADFNTTRPIKLTVTLPAGALQAVSHQGAGAEMFVGPGFKVPSFTATSAYGAGRLYVSGMEAQTVTEVVSSTGDSVLAGTFGTVNVTSTGTGSIYITGVQTSVVLQMNGVSDAYVQPASEAVTITGTAQGLNTVQYTTGSCTVQSALGTGIFFVCQQVPFLSGFPAPNPVWTCGMATQGMFTCSPGDGLAFTSFKGMDTSSGAVGTYPTTAVGERSIFTPSSFQFAGPAPAGQGSQQQSGSVTGQGTQASSSVAGSGPVSAVSVAGPSGAQTSTTQGGQTTSFQTTGQQTSGSVASSARASSTAFGTSTSSSTASATAGDQSAAGSVGGVVRVTAAGQATATSQACEAFPAELVMPTGL